MLAGSSHAQCSGSGVAFSCAAGTTQAQVQTALNSASNGAVLTFANGSYTWNAGHITFSNVNGASLICATVRGCIVSSSGQSVIGWAQWATGTNNNPYRISGFVFNDSSGQRLINGPYSGACGTGNSPCIVGSIRVDHNTFNLAAGAIAVSFADDASVFYVFGDIDDNILNSAGSAQLVDMEAGTNNSPMPNALGTSNNLFVETNTLTMTTMTNAGMACIDSWGSARMVFRYNTYLNCLAAAHGVTHAGGPDSIEFYGNHGSVDANAIGQSEGDGYRLWHHQGSGLFIGFNNTFTAAPGQGHSNSPFEMLHYRSYGNMPPGPAPNGSIDNAVIYCKGDVTNPPDGNRSPTATYQGYPCWRQPGRDPATGNYAPLYSWNNTWSDGTAFPNNGGLNFPDGGYGNPDYYAQQTQQNREWYNPVSPTAQTSPTSPFNGTTGMGYGTLANRPTTCTTSSESALGHGQAGVGYFATDVGSQGTLYTCFATNNWMVYYTPYQYPFVPGGGGGSPIVSWSQSSVNFGSVPVAPSPLCPTYCVNLTLTNTGTATLTVTLPYNTSDPTQFIIITNGIAACGGSLAPGVSCTDTIQFSPQSTGMPPGSPINGSLALTTNAASTPVVTFTGIGTSSVISTPTTPGSPIMTASGKVF